MTNKNLQPGEISCDNCEECPVKKKLLSYGKIMRDKKEEIKFKIRLNFCKKSVFNN